MPAVMRVLIQALKETVKEWYDDSAPVWSAAIAFYTVFSLAPILVVVVGLAGLVWEQRAVREAVREEFEQMAGPRAAGQVETVIDRAYQPEEGRWATLAGVAAVFLGATAVFGTLRSALNTVWGVTESASLWRSLVLGRLLSFAMVLAVAFLLMVSLVVSAALAGFGHWIDARLPASVPTLRLINIVVSWLVFTLLFAAIFKWLPDTHISWKDVWVGASVTSVLFAIGKVGIGAYLGRTTVASAYGAAGSLVILLLWIYYSAMAFLLGAEFTQVYARRWGSQIVPNQDLQKKRERREGPLGQPPRSGLP